MPVHPSITQVAGPYYDTAAVNQPAPVPINAPRKAIDFNNVARLATLPSSGYSVAGDEGRVVIYLPHLPEEIELSRENQYFTTSNPAMPDGLWIYESTTALEIPVQFTLHAFDEFCPEGPKTLLDIGARLHSLMLPASNDPFRRTKKPSVIFNQANAVAEETSNLLVTPEETATAPISTGDTSVKFPPTCSLRLIQAGARGLGVHCVGFVKGVKVTLHGPYLQTTDRANSYNLPSAATFGFTFVHNPAYTNFIQSGGALVQATGPDIFAYFYNTQHLSAASGFKYHDVEELRS